MKAYHYFEGILFFKHEPESRSEAFLTIGPDTGFAICRADYGTGWDIGIPEWLWSIVWSATQWIPVW